jgi:hypothetical protein
METKDMTPLHLRKSISWSPLRLGLLLLPLALAFFALSQTARAVSPAPDGGYPNGNTAEGDNALLSLTTGAYNTAIGFDALVFNKTGSYNTATGSLALFSNTGNFNTADGFEALFSNTTGYFNTASGFQALLSNTTGHDNTATGLQALFSNTTGSDNTAIGFQALLHNTLGSSNTGASSNNTAVGSQALFSNTQGGANTAVGYNALFSNTGTPSGSGNTAIGFQALVFNTGSVNIALGQNAGINLTTGDNNIDIGNFGAAGESDTIRIGSAQGATYIAGINGVNQGSPTAVFINTTTGQLGTQAPTSSRRFKKEIKPMDQTSEAILALKPVTFQYKSDSKGTPQFGLIAEEVAAVNPDLVVRDENGEIYTVRYEAVNAMLLNEFLKQHLKVEEHHRKVEEHHRTVQELEAAITQLKSTVAKQEAIIAHQQKGMEAVTARLEEHASKIQKVSDQLELNKPAPHMVSSNQ